MVAEGLSQLGRSADGTMQVFLSLSLQVRKIVPSNLKNREECHILLQESSKDPLVISKQHWGEGLIKIHSDY